MESYKKNAYVYATIVAIGGFIFGLDAALISGTVNYISLEFGLSDLQIGTVVSAPGLGVLLALPLAAYACNVLGRKVTLQIIAFLYLFSAITSTIAPTYLSLVGARFLGGLAFSSISLASMYIGEIAPPKWRGKLVSMTQINIVLGLSAAYFINYIILGWSNSEADWVTAWRLDTNTWRWMLGSEILPALIWFVLLLFIPKSPAWLVYRNRPSEALRTLQRIFPKKEATDQLSEMKERMEKGKDQNSLSSQFRQIFSKPMRVTLIIAVTIAIAQQATGINAILFYAPTVFEQLGVGTDAAFMQAIWVGVTSVVFTILGLFLVDTLGRRPLIIYGMIWIILSLGICFYGFNSASYTLSKESVTQIKELQNPERLDGIVGVAYHSDVEFKNSLIAQIGETDYKKFSGLLIEKSANINAILILIGILSFIAAFHFSVGPVMWVLFSEIFPVSIRAIAIPFFTLITSIVSYLVQKFFPWQMATMGISKTLLFYAIIVSIGLIILNKYLVETKNLTIEEIQIKIKNRFNKKI